MEGSEEKREAKGPQAPDRRELAIELSVFLLLILPPLALSTLEIRHSSLPFPLAATATILDDLGIVVLVLFLIWRNGEPFARIGWNIENLPSDVILGVVLFVPVLVGVGLLGSGLSALGIRASSMTPSFLQFQGPAQAGLAFVLVIVVALAEETIFRGYLVTRLQEVTSSPLAAVLISSAIFSMGHGYEGLGGVVITGVIGAVYALIFLTRRSIVTPVVLHFLQDLTTILLLPTLGIH